MRLACQRFFVSFSSLSLIDVDMKNQHKVCVLR